MKQNILIQIYGIDFSGAKDAGKRIWIAKGIPKGKNLLIKECFRVRDLPNSGRQPEVCLPALVNLIQSDQNAVFGFDFPFGLPDSLVMGKTWEEFVLSFPKKYKSPEVFRDECRNTNGGHELKRQTDMDAHTPFSPYNLRLYKQTYHGISKILFPLVQERGASVLPFQEPDNNKPWLLEICPASTLRSLGLHGNPYKGRTERHRNYRAQILQDVLKAGLIIIDNKIKNKIIADKGGDALDSVIAAMATLNAIKNQDTLIPDDNGHWKIEGHVYV